MSRAIRRVLMFAAALAAVPTFAADLGSGKELTLTACRTISDQETYGRCKKTGLEHTQKHETEMAARGQRPRFQASLIAKLCTLTMDQDDRDICVRTSGENAKLPLLSTMQAFCNKNSPKVLFGLLPKAKPYNDCMFTELVDYAENRPLRSLQSSVDNREPGAMSEVNKAGTSNSPGQSGASASDAGSVY